MCGEGLSGRGWGTHRHEIALILLAQLFDTIGIPETVERMLNRENLRHTGRINDWREGEERRRRMRGLQRVRAGEGRARSTAKDEGKERAPPKDEGCVDKIRPWH